MVNEINDGIEATRQERLGGRAVLLILLLHATAVAIATHPAVVGFRSAMPANPDAWVHVWTLRWYKTCLLEGRSVLLCPEIQYPVGAPLGSLSPMHFQSLLYLPLSFVISNDVLCYNLLWMTGLLLTGLGTSLLAWHLLGDRACAAFAGLLAMLSAPMMIHASAHLDLVYFGWFPIFMVWWMRFVDRPSLGRLAAAALGYLLVSMCHGYYMVFAIFPAVLYAVWSALRGGLRQVGPWVRSRAPWFAGMIGLTLPGLLVLFSGHLWSTVHGFALPRSRAEFNQYAAPLWGYAIPTARHLLGTLLPSDAYARLGASAPERTAYLGVVTIALLAYAAIRRVEVRKASYLWSALIVMVVLSLGASRRIGGWDVSLPSAWLWDVFPPMRMTRVPSRFSLLAGVFGGVLAAAGLKDLLVRIKRQGRRAAVFGGLTVFAVADLAMVGFPKAAPPPMPGCYAFLKRLDPKGTLLEVPYTVAGGTSLYGECTYWQSLHRLTTSAGYTAQDNAVQERLIGNNCPVLARRLSQQDYLENPQAIDIDLLTDVDFKDYLWVYMTLNKFDYLVLHQRVASLPEYTVNVDRMKALLQPCAIYDDGVSIVYARSRLKSPSGPIPITRAGWAQESLWQGQRNWLLPKTVLFAIYNPDPEQDLTLTLDGAAVRRSRSVRVRAGNKEVARWEVTPGTYQSVSSPPFRLAAGMHELTIESESQDPNPRHTEEKRPYRLRVASLRVAPSPDREAIARRDREDQLSPVRSAR